MPDDIQFHAGSLSIPTATILAQLEDVERRSAYVAESVRVRLALLIRAIREQRGWSQSQLAQAMGKTQSAISRLEDPDYGKYSLSTLLEIAATFGLPLYIDLPEWDDWFRLMADHSQHNLQRNPFDKTRLLAQRERETIAASAYRYSYISDEWAAALSNNLWGWPPTKVSGDVVELTPASPIWTTITVGAATGFIAYVGTTTAAPNIGGIVGNDQALSIAAGE